MAKHNTITVSQYSKTQNDHGYWVWQSTKRSG